MRVKAVLNGCTLKDECIAMIEAHCGTVAPRVAGVGVLEGNEHVRTTTVSPVNSNQCHVCGGLNGLHQKGCKR